MKPSILKSRPVDIYRAVWRWHFYAGLLVLPFLMILAVTGAIYLFHTEIDDIVYRDLKTVPASASAVLPHSFLVSKALAVYPGTAFKYVPAATTRRAAEVSIKTAGGDKILAYVNPHDGKVQGMLPDKGGVVWTIRRLHSLDYFGKFANALIEVAAGWSILLVLTGIYLWWPRHQGGGVVSVRGSPSQRTFWRDLHAVTGIFVAAFILFLALTGMPWSLVWGSKVNQWANGNNFGYPAGVRVSVPMSDEHLNHVAPTSWALEQARLPVSAAPEHEHASAGQTTIGLDQAVASFDALGISKGYAISLPSGPAGIYTGSVYPNDVSRQRVIHLDQYSGKPLLDMQYADYGPLGKGLEWGISVHMGQEFGLLNQLLMLAACLAIMLLCVSAAVMWWKRRPAGGIGVPPLPANTRSQKVIFLLLAIGGVVFPLVGISMLCMLLLDYVFIIRHR